MPKHRHTGKSTCIRKPASWTNFSKTGAVKLLLRFNQPSLQSDSEYQPFFLCFRKNRATPFKQTHMHRTEQANQLTVFGSRSRILFSHDRSISWLSPRNQVTPIISARWQPTSLFSSFSLQLLPPLKIPR
jgi:hypothetical protein